MLGSGATNKDWACADSLGVGVGKLQPVGQTKPTTCFCMACKLIMFFLFVFYCL